ncbi:MAG: hypothetical protein R3F15_14760 [Lysobacterales bacterium]
MAKIAQHGHGISLKRGEVIALVDLFTPDRQGKSQNEYRHDVGVQLDSASKQRKSRSRIPEIVKESDGTFLAVNAVWWVVDLLGFRPAELPLPEGGRVINMAASIQVRVALEAAKRRLMPDTIADCHELIGRLYDYIVKAEERSKRRRRRG